MSSSSKQPSELKVNNIRFKNGSELGITNTITTDLHLKKRLRLDGDLVTTGRINYVDNQTGWGLPQWTLANTGTYSKQHDSLIAKMKIIEDNYATIQYVDSVAIADTSSNGLTYYDVGTYPLYSNSAGTYTYPVTTLAQNTALILRDSLTTSMDFKIQKGSVMIGKVLTCKDTEGTVGWDTVGSGAVSVEITTITSMNGTSNSYSFRVVDTGVLGTAQTKGLYIYPDILNNSFNKALTPHDYALLGGLGDIASTSGRTFIGPFSVGSEGISFNGSYQVGSTIYPGKTKISGGYWNQSTSVDQSITLDTNGVILKSGPSKVVLVDLPIVTKNLSINTWTRPMVVRGKWGTSEYPVFAALKTDETGLINRGIILNPYIGGRNFSSLHRAGDLSILGSDFGDFFSDGSSTVFNEKILQFVISVWSQYGDGIVIRPTLQLEETLTPKPITSGYTRLSSGATVIFETPNKYLELNRDGLTILHTAASKTTHYGRFDIINKVDAILNNSQTDVISSSFNVGTTSSQVASTFFGDLTIKRGGLIYNPTEEYLNTDMFLGCYDTQGRVIWKPLPTYYTSLEVTILNAPTIESSYLKLSNTLYLHTNDLSIFYQSMQETGSHIFQFRTSDQLSFITPFEITQNYVHVNKPFVFSDNSVQTSAYTGAKNLAGSYTNTNITIDANGQITSLSSNPFFLPSTITSPVTFNALITFLDTVRINPPVGASKDFEVGSNVNVYINGPTRFSSSVVLSDSVLMYPPAGVTKALDLGPNIQLYVNGSSFFSRPPTIYSDGIANKLLQSSSTGQTAWSENIELNSITTRKLTMGGLINTYINENQQSIAILEGAHLMSFQHTPARLTNYYYETNYRPIATCRFDVEQTNLYNWKIPVRVYLEWTYRDDIHQNDELIKFTFVLEDYTVQIINLTNGYTEEWNHSFDGRPNVKVTHDRYQGTPNYYCNKASTIWKFHVPLAMININWSPPIGSLHQYQISLKFHGKYFNEGEYMNINDLIIETNYVLAEYDPYLFSVIQPVPDTHV